MKKLIALLCVLCVFAGMLPTAAFVAGAAFDDIDEDDWYYNAANYCARHGLMSGTAERTFSPSLGVTRAMLVVTLARLASADLSSYTVSPFADVAPGKWYAGAVAWAAGNGLCAGTGGGLFEPGGVLTRAQLAVFLYSYARMAEYDTTLAFDMSVFTDAPRADAWYAGALEWAAARACGKKPSIRLSRAGTTAWR